MIWCQGTKNDQKIGLSHKSYQPVKWAQVTKTLLVGAIAKTMTVFKQVSSHLSLLQTGNRAPKSMLHYYQAGRFQFSWNYPTKCLTNSELSCTLNTTQIQNAFPENGVKNVNISKKGMPLTSWGKLKQNKLKLK